MTVPDAPTGVVGTAGDSSVQVSWSAPASDGGSPITDYEVSVYDSSGGVATGATGTTSRLVGSATTNYAFTGLSNGTAYTFRVVALNATGTGSASALSDSVVPATVPSAPRNVSA